MGASSLRNGCLLAAYWSGSATWTTALGQQHIKQFSALFSRFQQQPAPPSRGVGGRTVAQ
eukprot:3115779-Alexandrium_andersonii.AAC.1